MAATTIEWTDYTFNPWRGCTKISPGCANCYAEKLGKRNPAVLGEWGPSGRRVVAAESYWRLPLKWDREAAEAGERRKVFCASLADVFDDWPGQLGHSSGGEIVMWARLNDGQWCAGVVCDTPMLYRQLTLDDARIRLWRLIDETPNLDWLLLTKRPQNFRDMLPWPGWPRKNVWLGVSVEDQARADERIPELLATPAAVRFLSCEPLLGPINLVRWLTPFHGLHAQHNGIDWVIVGGESGPQARPMHPAWALSLRDQCQAAGMAFFFKQFGEWSPGNGSTEQRAGVAAIHRGNRHGAVAFVGDDREAMFRLGKKVAGRLLDGREWSEFPNKKERSKA